MRSVEHLFKVCNAFYEFGLYETQNMVYIKKKAQSIVIEERLCYDHVLLIIQIRFVLQRVINNI